MFRLTLVIAFYATFSSQAFSDSTLLERIAVAKYIGVETGGAISFADYLASLYDRRIQCKRQSKR